MAWNPMTRRPLVLESHDYPDGVRQAISEDVIVISRCGAEFRGRFWVTHFLGGESSATWSCQDAVAWRHIQERDREADRWAALAGMFNCLTNAIAHEAIMHEVEAGQLEAQANYHY